MSAHFQVEALPGQAGFGAIVTGLRQADIGDKAVQAALLELFIDKGLIVFRGVDGGADAHVELSQVFGECELHPLHTDIPGQHPTLIDLRYDPSKQDGYEVNGEMRWGWLPWHSDLVYVDRINRGGILRPIHLPATGGETGFIDQIAAYDALPDDLKARCEGLNILYRANFDATNQRFGVRGTVRRTSELSDRVKQLHAQNRPRVIHPLIYRQQDTGRRVLNLSPWFADGIEGMENPEGDALLAEIAAWVTRPELAHYHRWRLDEMVLWDNWRMIHCATGVPVGETRHMQRTTIAGDYALGRIEASADASDARAVLRDPTLTPMV